MTSEILDELYNIKWYRLRPSDRRYLVTMLSMAHQPFSIDFQGLFPSDLENLLNMFNSSYSYFMFLKSME